MEEIKVGDTVRVREYQPFFRQQFPYFWASMKAYCGKEYEVGAIRGWVKLKGIHFYHFHPDWLEKVEVKTKKEEDMKHLLEVNEVAQILNCHPAYISVLKRRGKLTPVGKRNSNFLYDESDVRKYLETKNPVGRTPGFKKQTTPEVTVVPLFQKAEEKIEKTVDSQMAVTPDEAKVLKAVELYKNSGKSSSAIAKEVGTSKASIQGWMKRLGVKRITPPTYTTPNLKRYDWSKLKMLSSK